MEKTILLHALSLLLNLCLGYLRRGKPRMSFLWLLYIHASIPIIIPLRLLWHVSAHYIPSLILCAVIGQVMGSVLIPRRCERQ